MSAIGCTEKNMVNGYSHHEQLACFVVQKMESVLQQEGEIVACIYFLWLKKIQNIFYLKSTKT